MVDILKEYINKRIELIKLQTTEKTSVGLGIILFLILAFAFMSFFVLMLNIAVGLLIGHSLGNYGYGLLIVSVFYLLLFILVLVYRNQIINRVADKIIEFIEN